MAEEECITRAMWVSKCEAVRTFSEMQIWVHKHLIHFVAAFFLTGLPLISKDWFGWLAYLYSYPVSVVIGPVYDPYSLGMEIARLIHRLSAFGLALVLIPFFLGELGALRRMEIWPECWSWSCFKKGISDMVDFYIHKKPAVFPKYNLGQKGWIWTVLIGMIIMYITGIIMWFRGMFSPSIWGWAHLIHDIGFFIAAIGLIIHVYMAVLIPEHRPMVRAMFRTGRLTEEYVSKHLPKWLQKSKEES